MVAICPLCSRTNAADARFCWHDGVSIFGTSLQAVPPQNFPMPFVFPSGRRCHNFEELACGCVESWEEAILVLQKGGFDGFFSGLGRMDLMQASQEAATYPDSDRGLDQMLTRLPVKTLPTAKLEVQQKAINLGIFKLGTNGQFKLQLENTGSRVIFGSISSDCKWLAPTNTGEAKCFSFRQRATLTITIQGRHLRAAAKPLQGNLLIETNAGTVNLAATIQVPIRPYPDDVFAGATTPREVAEKAKLAPKQAALLFEQGAVAKWYQSNNWTYPVQGPTANGLAAVQQFFEALGLSKPPKVQLSEMRIVLKGKPGTRLLYQLQLRSDENRPVYAHGLCREDWLVVQPAQLQGTTATLPIEITVPACLGENVKAMIKVHANGNQQFDVPVQLTVEAPLVAISSGVSSSAIQDRASMTSTKTLAKTASDFAPIPAPPVIAKSAPVETPAAARSRWAHLIPLALLILPLLILIGLDLQRDIPAEERVVVRDEPVEARFDFKVDEEPDEMPVVVPVVKIDDLPEEGVKLPTAPAKVVIKDEPAENNVGKVVPINPTPLVRYTLSSPPKTFGVSKANGVQLTFSSDGATNSTMASVNGTKTELGGSQGKWTRKNQQLDGIAATPGSVQASRSIWTWNKVEFHQVLEVVPGQPVMVDGKLQRQLDAVLVRWIIRNKGNTLQPVCLRLMVDTLIGDNDGVPFTIPGKADLVDSFDDFRKAAEIPDFIQALERPNLKDPGTVAHMTLKAGAELEPPSRVTLTHWKGRSGLFTGLAGSLVWDIPVNNMGADSAVVLYWPEKMLAPNESRTIGFAYGLGNVSSNDKLGVTLGGSFEPGQIFTTTAYVENPIAGQTLRLELPPGLRREEGMETQDVAMPKNGKTSIVTWKVMVERPGEFRLKVISSTGLSQAKTISIVQEAATGGKLRLELQGPFEPGQPFTVIGHVEEPTAKQTLTLQLTGGLEKTAGELTQAVPALSAGSKEAVVQWKVRVPEAGKYPIRVSSSTGVTQAKTITIENAVRPEGMFKINLEGEFAPEKVFTVSAKVAEPAPNQKLTLILPPGLERVFGDETQSPLPNEPLLWKVKVREIGKHTVGVKSTTGVTQRKTFLIEPPGDQAGRFNFTIEGLTRPNKKFLIKAEVTNPVAGQTLTLVLKEGLQLAGSEAIQQVPQGGANGVSTVSWEVIAIRSGSLPVRIESSTRLTRSKTINLRETTSSLFGQGAK